jgi:predicted amidohydrolase
VPLPSLRDDLAAATSLMDLARRLGATVLEDGGRLLQLLHDPRGEKARCHVEQTLESLAPEAFEPSPDHGFLHLLDVHDLTSVVDLMRADSRVEHLAFLRGLCRGPVLDFFERTESTLVLDRGMPIPFATRPVRALFGQATPYQPTLARSGLLEGLGHGLFEHVASGPIRVVLDFGFRNRLDELTWTADERLPCIATLHPALADTGLEIGVLQDDRFFDVRPRRWDDADVLERLRAVAEVQIAVLPELSLPAPDALEAALAAEPHRYPPVVVAGSAHVREQRPDGSEIRANEARVYVDGQLASVHRKIHAYATRHLNGVKRARPWVEDLTAEPKTITVLSGSHTRLAVVICADLNDEGSRVPGLLEAAGVNLLLVPALTDDLGAFTGAVSGIASRCQGVAVVVNGDRSNGTDDAAPFLALAAVPRPAPRDQLRLYPENAREPRGALGILDPNVDLWRAMDWSRSD